MEDYLFIVRYCIEGSNKRVKPLFVMAIDFAKVFNSVNRVALLRTLMWHGCDLYLIQVVTELCTGDCIEIFQGELRVGQMEVSNGIWQGCTGSPQLFVMIVNMIIREILDSTVGYRDEALYIPALFFADDGLLMANSRKQAEQLLDMMRDAAGRCGLDMNDMKSKCEIFNYRGALIERLKRMEVEKQLRYLGVTVVN